jgi:hypothetical protein
VIDIVVNPQLGLHCYAKEFFFFPLRRYSNPGPTCALWQAAALTYELCYILFKLVHV